MRLSHLFGNNTAPHAALPGAAPLSAGPFGGAVSSPGVSYPHGAGLPGLQRLLGVQSFRNAQRANPLLWSSLEQLINQGNTNQFSGEDRANYLAPRLQALGSAKLSAEGDLTRDLAARGLGDSSSMAEGLGAIKIGAGQGRAQALQGLYGEEQNRQLGAQGDARSMLMALLSGQQGMGLNALSQLRSQNLQEAQFNQGNQFDLGGMLSALLGAGGSFAGGPLAGKLFGGK